MQIRSISLVMKRRRVRAALVLTGCLLTLPCVAQARGQDAQPTGGSPTPPSGAQGSSGAISAVLEQCLTTGALAERSATFSGEMSAIPGATRMQMRIDIEERLPDEARFHTVTAPGLGVWRSSAPGVRAYKYLRQVTNLSAPAFYRGAIRFRWLTARGVLIKVLDRRTPVCEQPAPEITPTTGTATTGTDSTATTTTGVGSSISSTG